MGRRSRTAEQEILPHHGLTRLLTVRETKENKTFLDDFIFIGSDSGSYR